jgi:outer membrane protein
MYRLAAISAAVLAAGVAPASAETLKEALAMAYSTNPQLLSGRASLRATDEQVPQALSNWRPTVQITSSGSLSRIYNSTTGGSAGLTTVTLPGGGTVSTGGGGSGTSQQTVTSQNYQATLSQPLYRGGRTVAQTSEAENLVRASRASLIATEETVLLNATTAFFAVVRDQNLLDIEIENEQLLRQQLQATQAQLRAGTALDTDVQLAQARLSAAIAARQTAEGNLATSRETYLQAVGQMPGKLTAPTERPALPTSLEEVKKLAATAAPTVVSADYTRAAAVDAVQVVRGALLPTLSLNGTAARSITDTASERTTNQLSVTAQMTVPLYEAGSIYSQTRAAQQTVAQRTHDLDTARRQAVETAGAAWDTFVSAHASIESNLDAVRADDAALKGVRAGYLAGTRSIIDVLNELQILITDRINLVTAQFNEAVAIYQVTSSIGRLTAIDLNLPVDIYDPQRNYDSVRTKWGGFETHD